MSTVECKLKLISDFDFNYGELFSVLEQIEIFQIVFFNTELILCTIFWLHSTTISPKSQIKKFSKKN